MSGLWSGQPASVKLADLDVICAVLGCDVSELLIPEPGMAAGPVSEQAAAMTAGAAPPRPPVLPRRRDGRSLPPA
jgi:hypothetical protein